MALIDKSFFNGEILITGLEGNNPVISSIVANLNIFITKYEKEYLILVLGEKLYNEFKIGLATQPLEQKWIDLKNKFVDLELKSSPIADYVYYFYMRDRASHTSMLHETVSRAENSDVVINTSKMMIAYNNAMEKGESVRTFVSINSDIYGVVVFDSVSIVNYSWLNVPYPTFNNKFARINNFGL